MENTSQTLKILCGGRTWKICREADLETLWDAMDQDAFEEDERIPYWAELWPSSLLLGEWVSNHADLFQDAHVLDLGCGLGLVSGISAHTGAQVVAMDYEQDAVFQARRNCHHNDAHLQYVVMDWRNNGFKDRSFDWILGADILYEKRFVNVLVPFIKQVLRPQGRVLVAEPYRGVSTEVWDFIEHEGFTVNLLENKSITWNDHQVELYLRELRLPKSNSGG